MNDKELVAHAALEYVKDNSIIGLGQGLLQIFLLKCLQKKYVVVH